jgi:hypothetical protein
MKRLAFSISFALSLLIIPSFQIINVHALVAESVNDNKKSTTSLEDSRIERLENRQEKLEERTKKVEELKNTAGERRCEIVEQNIDRLINRYDALHPQIVGRYENAVDRLEDLNQRLLNEGYDTSDVQFALDYMSNMVIEISQMNIDLQIKLADAKALSCNENEVLYRDTVQEAQEMLKNMKERAQEIKDYYISDVKPAVQELKDQVRNNRNSDSINQ